MSQNLKEKLPSGCKCFTCEKLSECITVYSAQTQGSVKVEDALKRAKKLPQLTKEEQVQEIQALTTDLEQALKGEVYAASQQVNPIVARLVCMGGDAFKVALLNWVKKQNFGSFSQRRRQRKRL